MGKIARLNSIVSVFFLVWALTELTTSNCYAAIKEGNYCWNLKITENETGPVPTQTYLMKMHIAPIGNGTTASLTGKVIVSDDNSPLLTGIATVSSTMISGNLVGTQIHTGTSRDTSIIRMNMNPTTLSGTFYEVGHDFDRGNHTFDERFTAGRLVPVQCK